MTTADVLTVLYANGAWVPIAKLPTGRIGVGVLGVVDACDELAYPPPLDLADPETPAGFITVAALRAWGERSSAAAAIQAHELAEIVTTWVAKFESIKTETDNENV